MQTRSNLVTIAVVVAILILALLAIIVAYPRPHAPVPVPNTPALSPSATNPIPASATAAATTLPVIGTPLPGALVRVWSAMCVEGVPYTLFSVPLDARFALVQAEAHVPATSIPFTGMTALPSPIPTFSTPSFVGGTAGPLPTATSQPGNGAAIVPATGSNGSLGIVPSQNSCTPLGQLNGLQMIMCTGPEGNPFTFFVREADKAQVYQGTLWNCTLPSSTPVPGILPTASQTLQPTALPSTVPTTLPTTAPTTAVPPTSQPTSPPPTAASTQPPPVTPTP